jgi:hypothetical protein
MKNSVTWIIAGQVLLIVCCVFYLIWWSMSYRPGVVVNRVGGIRGVLLAVTAAAGFAGAFICMHGISGVPKDGAALKGSTVIIAGLAAYFILLFVTQYGLGRPVTTELALINGWAVLEICASNALNCAGRLDPEKFTTALWIIAAAYLLSMILYIIYYRVDEDLAFYLAMVPLISEAAAMAAITLMAR